MMVHQAIENPYGINVFGSALIRIAPDLVEIKFSVSKLEEHPAEAFRNTRETAHQVRTYLAEAKVKEVQSSRVNLSQTSRYVNNETRFVGYTAHIEFRVLLYDLDRMEEILVGVVDAGVNRIDSVQFQTTQLKEIRAKARQQAIKAAHDKALIYCDAANVGLGKVLHIEDVNPEQLGGHEGHVMREIPLEDEGTSQTLAPGSIAVGAAVMISYTIINS